MASRYLAILTGSVNWNSTASWSATNGGASGASVPVSGDTVYILNGNANINSGLDQSAVTNITLNISFGGSIGTDTTSLVFADIAGASISNSPTVYIGAITTGTYIVFEQSPCSVRITDGVVTNLFMGDGIVTLGSGVDAWTASVFGGQLFLDSSSTAGTGVCSFSVYSGFVSCGRPMSGASDTVNIFGGSFVYTNNATMNSVNATSGATYFHQCGANIGLAATSAGANLIAANATAPFTVSQLSLFSNGFAFGYSPVAVTVTTRTRYGTNRFA